MLIIISYSKKKVGLVSCREERVEISGEMKKEQDDRDDAQEITDFGKYIFRRKSLSQTNISKGRRGNDFIPFHK